MRNERVVLKFGGHNSGVQERNLPPIFRRNRPYPRTPPVGNLNYLSRSSKTYRRVARVVGWNRDR
jgi:hypothetical protein